MPNGRKTRGRIVDYLAVTESGIRPDSHNARLIAQ